MPSIPVAPPTPVDLEGPVLGGVPFRRPNRRSVSTEPVRATVTLAGGALRSYDAGRRRVVSLTWAKLTGAELAALTAALAPVAVSYAEDSAAAPFVVNTDEAISAEAIPGTYPVRHEVTVTLRERDTVR